LLFLATALVLVSRLPFLLPGYGADPDAWHTASACRLIAETGVYHESHSPGHPVQEWIGSLLWRGGPWALNGATAMASALAALCFGLAFVALGGGAWSAVGALAMAFAPIVYIHSVDAMDYVWALSFSMVALWLVLRDRWLGAGLALGLAIGSRMTAGLLVFPLVLLGWTRNGWKTRPGARAGFVLVALALSGALYIPEFAQHGTEMFALSPAPYPSALRLAQDMTLELWGTIGGLALGLALLAGLAGGRGATVLRGSPGWVGCALLAVLLYVAAFLRLPDEAAYLIPVVPFVILLLARVSRPGVFAVTCVAIVLSPFFLDLGLPESSPLGPGEIALPSQHPRVIVRLSEGALLVDHRQRVTGVKNGEGLLAALHEVREPAVVVCAAWRRQLEVISHDGVPSDVRLVEYVSAREADSLRHAGSHLYYVRGSEAGSLYYEHIDLDSLGGRPLGYEPTP